ncbi:peptidyl-prolyl cis-trans isomerase, putative [Hepatocystis sp. ex Piliocolobus tephrosceles]|uniref:Peptidyl-prolyl cis-trans isomerase n=1 Tax=Piliocolobus tephrosceles TaxID=591936 RepID=A0A8C9GMS6_9PRIM|nr:peptidyl-prolyl cis-trans isomerase, putative [Hepatocystis sp. ex Piliocolobus tephrosceles]VWU50334.1 peptidyl-prolyl cis-trans isomerase, putative [Hepatocystis sp. ex Piliocolobus tephrosceles]
MNRTLSIILVILYLFQKCYIQASNPEITDRVYFDVTIDNKDIGRIVFGLYGKTVPKTVSNFLGLCKGTIVKGNMLHYKNSIFHRIIPMFMAQGGDITHFDGTGGLSIYGNKFDDENFEVKHSKRGMLSMANAGRNTNGSQFFILFAPAPWLDGHHVVFGEVTEGLDKLMYLEAVGTDSGTPMKKVLVKDSGVL